MFAFAATNSISRCIYSEKLRMENILFNYNEITMLKLIYHGQGEVVVLI